MTAANLNKKAVPKQDNIRVRLVCSPYGWFGSPKLFIVVLFNERLRFLISGIIDEVKKSQLSSINTQHSKFNSFSDII